MKHILMIDDEEMVRQLLHQALSRGYRVTGVGSAVEAMQVVRDDPPDLILTDLQLEETDGFEVVEQVKTIAPDIPIVMITGVLFDPQMIAGPGKKIAGFIEKTRPLDYILREVKRHLSEPGAGR